jgi:hypothetical protein
VIELGCDSFKPTRFLSVQTQDTSNNMVELNTATNGDSQASTSAVNGVASTSSTGGSDNILLISSMEQTRDESFQATLEQLKASTSQAVRPEMIDRILDGGELLQFCGSCRTSCPTLFAYRESSHSCSYPAQLPSYLNQDINASLLYYPSLL